MSKSFADQWWPGQSAVGRRMGLGYWGDEEPWSTIVGQSPFMAMTAMIIMMIMREACRIHVDRKPG